MSNNLQLYPSLSRLLAREKPTSEQLRKIAEKRVRQIRLDLITLTTTDGLTIDERTQLLNDVQAAVNRAQKILGKIEVQ